MLEFTAVGRPSACGHRDPARWTHFHSVPETGEGIVVLTNSQRSWPMIARILGDWSEWAGIPPVGMTLITRATSTLWIVIATLGAVAVAASGFVVVGLAQRRRTLTTRGRWRGSRLAAGLAAAVLLVTVIVGWTTDLWAFFLVPLFPAASTWLAASVLAVAAALLIVATTPRDSPATFP